jgi:hypothetical protein
MLTSYLHLDLRMSGVVLLLPLYVFVAWTGAAIPFMS